MRAQWIYAYSDNQAGYSMLEDRPWVVVHYQPIMSRQAGTHVSGVVSPHPTDLQLRSVGTSNHTN